MALVTSDKVQYKPHIVSTLSGAIHRKRAKLSNKLIVSTLSGAIHRKRAKLSNKLTI